MNAGFLMAVMFSEAEVDEKYSIVELPHSHNDILWFDVAVNEVA
jgi:hypothetical protein